MIATATIGGETGVIVASSPEKTLQFFGAPTTVNVAPGVAVQFTTSVPLRLDSQSVQAPFVFYTYCLRISGDQNPPSGFFVDAIQQSAVYTDFNPITTSLSYAFSQDEIPGAVDLEIGFCAATDVTDAEIMADQIMGFVSVFENVPPTNASGDRRGIQSKAPVRKINPALIAAIKRK